MAPTPVEIRFADVRSDSVGIVPPRAVGGQGAPPDEIDNPANAPYTIGNPFQVVDAPEAGGT